MKYKMVSNRRNEAVRDLLEMDFDENVISVEEGYLRVFDSVSYFYSNNYFKSLNNNYSFDDLVHEVYYTLLRRKSFNKFDGSKASKKTYISLLSKNVLTDMLRVLKETTPFSEMFETSCDDGDNTKMIDNLLSGRDFSEAFIEAETMRTFLERLDDVEGRVEGVSPFTGKKVKLTQRKLVEFLIYGYSVSDIQKMFINPVTKKNVTSTPIYNMIKKLKAQYIEA